MQHDNSSRYYQEALKLIPGGVNSPVRACRSVNADPLFIEHAQGAYVYDVDDNRYIDYVGSWGPMIIGHRHPEVVKAIDNILRKGMSFGAPTKLEIEMAGMIIDAVDAIEMVRMVNSGTEATMSAIRLARAATGRDIVVKFDGCYHGHADTLLVAAGSGVATLGIPDSPGVPESIVSKTISLPYNDLKSVETLYQRQGNQIACVIVEPVAGNMGMVPPVDGFLSGLRKLTQANGSLLIFDEVMTGFRVAFGGAQALYKIQPDITCLGKIIGGGLPVGAYGGKREIMTQIAPQGAVYQAGTLSGNPLAMAAGIATLRHLQTDSFYEKLDQKAAALLDGIQNAARQTGIEIQANRVGSMMGVFFTPQTVTNFNDAKTSDLQRYAAYYRKMRERGVYLAPSQFEALFVSAAHTYQDINFTLNAIESVFRDLKNDSKS